MRVQLEEVNFHSRGTQLLFDITCDLEEGVAVLIMGPSGSGKTLLMKIMAGIVPADNGNVLFDGRPFASMGDRELKQKRVRQGFVFQDAALWQNLTVYQNLSLPVEYHFPRRETEHVRSHITALCRKMDFRADLKQRPTVLSAGEQKVASILRALVLDPENVLMDEPSVGLDASSSARLLVVLKELKAKGRTLVIASHDSQIASMIADRIIVVDEGRILAYDSVNNLVRTDDPRLKAILSDVFELSSTYDADILDILGSSDDGTFA